VLAVLLDGTELPRVTAVLAGRVLAAVPIGPILGSWLLDRLWRGAVFLINVPVIVLAPALIVVLSPDPNETCQLSLEMPGPDHISVALMPLSQACRRNLLSKQ
jgi:MFS family permease